MRTLIVLAVLGVCSAVPTPFIEHTPEVAAERAKFFKAFNEAVAAAPPKSAPKQAIVSPSVAKPIVAAAPAAPVALAAPAAPAAPARWEGPFAATIPAGVKGALAQVPDTADVDAARKAFLASYEAQLLATNPAPAAVVPAPVAAPAPAPAPAPAAAPAPEAPVAKWAGPFAATKPAAVGGPLTPVSDTSDVKTATAEFLRAFEAAVIASAPAAASAATAAAPAPAAPVPAAPAAPAPAPVPAAAPVQARWTGPVAATVPAGLPGSAAQVPDTAEVAAARTAFLRVYEQAVLSAPASQ